MKIKDRLIERFLGAAISERVETRVKIETQKLAVLRAASVTDNEDIGWKRLTGDTTRNLSPLAQDEMIKIAYWLWETNPLANWIIEITKDFILAEGLPYESKNEDVKKVLDDFWYDPLNRMDLYMEKYVRELDIYGELCFPVFRGQHTGKVRLGYIDPANIKDVITDPENVKMVIGVTLKDSVGEVGRKYKTIVPKEAETILSRSAQALRETYTDGECFFFAVNNVTNSPRGRSSLLTVADWLDAYEQFLFDYAEKWPLLNTFVWDMEVQGGDDAAIKEQMKAFTKKSGSIYGHNEKVKLTPSTPDLKSVDAEQGARLFRNHILGAKSIPEHWYGGGGDVNRATSVEMGTPAYKTLSSKQRYFKFIVESIFECVIDSSRDARYLTVTDEAAALYSVITPELTSKDLSKYGAVIQQVAVSLGIAEANEWVDKETSQKIFATLMGYLGIDIDLASMKEGIKEEGEKKGYEDYTKGSGQGSGVGGR